MGLSEEISLVTLSECVTSIKLFFFVLFGINSVRKECLNFLMAFLIKISESNQNNNSETLDFHLLLQNKGKTVKALV